jgi:hypothetical protein
MRIDVERLGRSTPTPGGCRRMTLKVGSLADLLGFELTELAGAHAAGAVPLSAVLINRLIAARLSASEGRVAGVAIEPLDSDTIVAHVTLRSRLVPTLAIRLQIQQQPEFPSLPVLVLRWSMGGLGGLARLASPALALFDVLPPGVRVDGDLIGIDLATMLRAQGAGELVPHIREIRLATTKGQVIVTFDFRVSERAERTRDERRRTIGDVGDEELADREVADRQA